MNIYILGNGFDLHHKLPTTYLCFLKTVDYFNKQEMFVDPISIGKVFNAIKNECPNIEKSYDAYKNVYDAHCMDFDDCMKFHDLAKDNYWVNYFLRSYDEDVGWIDFEKEITKVINDFDTFFKNKEVPLSKYVSGYQYFNDSSKSRVDLFPFFINLDGNSLVTNCTCISKDYILKRTYDNNYVINSEKIIKELYNSLMEFAVILEIYFKLFVENPLDEIMSSGLLEENKLGFIDADYVVSFNYTNVFEKIYATKSKHDPFHIHGRLDKKIIVGTGNDRFDEIDNMDTTFLCFKKYYQRVLYKTDTDYFSFIERFKSEGFDAGHSVFVIGHSLDSIDKDIIINLFEHASNIIIYYHDDKSVASYITNLISIFGKYGFDSLRSNNNLQFVSLKV